MELSSLSEEKLITLLHVMNNFDDEQLLKKKKRAS